MKKPQKQATECFVSDCSRKATSPRGLCVSCYQTGLALVRTGQSTWDELERMGLCRPKQLSAGANPLSKAFHLLKLQDSQSQVTAAGQANRIANRVNGSHKARAN